MSLHPRPLRGIAWLGSHLLWAGDPQPPQSAAAGLFEGSFLARHSKTGLAGKAVIIDTGKLLERIASHETDLDALARQVARKCELLPTVLDGLASNEAPVRYGCLKVLRTLSENHPTALAHKIDFFINHLDSDNTFVKWGAILILGNLSAVDSKRKIDPILDRYLAPISGHVMITAANVMAGAAKIALARPQHADRIARALLQVENAQYQTAECRNVAIGHAIKAFAQFFPRIREKAAVVEFVRRQASNPRPATRKKAADFLKRNSLAQSQSKTANLS